MGAWRSIKLYSALILVQVAFSGWHVLGAIALDGGTLPLIFACYREILAVFCMYIVALFTDGCQFPERKHIPRFLLLGLFNFLNVALFILGLSLTNADIAAIYQCCIPVWTVLLGLTFKMEKLSVWKVVGILFAVAGAIITTLFSKGSKITQANEGSNHFWGNAMLVAQTLAMGAMIVAQRDMVLIYPHNSVVAWGYSGAALLSVLASLQYVDRENAWNLGGKKEAFIALIYAAVIATMFTYMTMGWANKQTSSSIVGAFMAFQPVSTCILSFIFQNQTITPLSSLGGALVLIGLITISVDKHRDEQRLKEYEDRLCQSFYKPFNSNEDSYHPDDKDGKRSDASAHFHTPVERRAMMGTGYTPGSRRQPCQRVISQHSSEKTGSREQVHTIECTASRSSSQNSRQGVRGHRAAPSEGLLMPPPKQHCEDRSRSI